MSKDWLADYATAILAGSGRIRQYFEPTLFADPARDILLNLFARERRGIDTRLDDCRDAARVPAAAAQRWIDVLLETGLIGYADRLPGDEPALVRMTPHAKSLMAKYLVGLATEGGLRPILSSIIIE